MKKKLGNRGQSQLLAVAGLIVVIIVSVTIAIIAGGGYAARQGWIGGRGGAVIPGVTTTIIAASTSCTHTSGLTTVAISNKNFLQTASDERRSITGYLMNPTKTARITTLSDMDASPGTYDAVCGNAYVIVGVTGANDASFEYDLGVVSGPLYNGGIYPTVNNAQLADLKFRVRNIVDGVWARDSSNNATTWQNANTTFGLDTNGATALTIGQDGSWSDRIYLKSQTTDAQFGEVIEEGSNDHMRSWVCADYNSSQLQAPFPTAQGVALTPIGALTNLKAIPSTISGDANNFIQCWELTKEMSKIGGKRPDDYYYVTFSWTALGSINPSTDVIYSFYSTGRALGTQGNSIVTGIVNDAAPPAYITYPATVTRDIT